MKYGWLYIMLINLQFFTISYLLTIFITEKNKQHTLFCGLSFTLELCPCSILQGNYQLGQQTG